MQQHHTSNTENSHTSQLGYKGNAPREITVEEMYALLHNIEDNDIIDIKRDRKYIHH